MTSRTPFVILAGLALGTLCSAQDAVPDLVVGRLQTTQTAAPGGALTVVITASNRSAVASSGFACRVDLVARAPEAAVITSAVWRVASLGAWRHSGSTQTMQIPGDVPAGEYDLRATVDTGAEVAESDEGNNTLQRVLTIQGTAPGPDRQEAPERGPEPPRERPGNEPRSPDRDDPHR